MEKKDLTEAIEEGVMNGFWKPVYYFIVIILIFEIIILSLMFYGNYRENKCREDGTCPITAVASPSCFPLENLYCRVIIGNETETSDTRDFSICGYQEANANFERIKPEIKDWLQKNNLSWEIKWLKCD